MPGSSKPAPPRDPAALRSHRWFGRDDLRGFAHRQRMQQIGFGREEFMGKPVIGIFNAWSGLSPCHSHLRERAQAAARGVLAAGGFPVEMPVLSLGEVMVKPTTMLYRNLLALEVEELMRSHPIDAAILLGGCDKTGPGMLMGAISADMPSIFVPAGPMINASWHGEKVGAGTHTRKFWDEHRAGKIDAKEWIALEAGMTRSIGTCNTMGTASTMTIALEALGMTLPGAASIPAADSEHERMVARAGGRIVDMAWERLAPSQILADGSFRNAVAAVLACGGSTNAPIHLIALARRAQVKLTLDGFERAATRVPVLVNLMPAGEHLMQDFFQAGGTRALFARIAGLLDGGSLTVSGGTFAAQNEGARVIDDNVIRPLERPVSTQPAMAVLYGNLAPGGALIKPTSATPRLLQHRGPALVFDGAADLAKRIDDPALPATADSVIVLRNAGPVGAPGMPEWGALPIPKKLLAQGVRDMLRISDARMSGTHYGACVLHAAPEAAAGGPLAFVRDGDAIELDFAARRLTLCIDDEELERRRQAWTPPAPHAERGYAALYARHVTQAPDGCDFDFLEGRGGVPEPEIY